MSIHVRVHLTQAYVHVYVTTCTFDQIMIQTYLIKVSKLLYGQ